MVETISPVVYGGRNGRWVGAVALHALGAVVAAAAAGLVLGAAGAAAGAPWGWAGAAVVAAAGLAYAARDLLGLPFPPLLEARRQVPEWWRTFFSPHVASLLYGLGLGVGFFTYLGHGTLVVVAAAAAAMGDPWLGAAVMAPFGLARAMAPLAAASSTSEEEAATAADRVEAFGRSRVRRAANAAASALVAGAAVLAIPAAGPAMAGPTRLAPLALAAVFAWAAGAKALRWDRWMRTVARHDLPPLVERAARGGVPVMEAGTALLLLTGFHRAGAVIAVVLLTGFTVVILRAALRTDGNEVPCGCFGKETRIDARLAVARNAALAVLAVAAFRVPSPATLPTEGAALPVTIAVVGAAAGTWFVIRATAAMRPRHGDRR
jgi:hypothetical protein